MLDSKTGGTYTVLRIELERDVSRRLQALGLTQGTRVSVLNRKRVVRLLYMSVEPGLQLENRLQKEYW